MTADACLQLSGGWPSSSGRSAASTFQRREGDMQLLSKISWLGDVHGLQQRFARTGD